ncbi:hypothetical protein PPL_09125 [Heterostelium album PN500]|uniref:Uncharacterized protein n=1 Tax=Heterostelium pallidum (strain ATCC 26659 / Pp 5 / PN500) TaxID=670386 RepID=D3BKP3_HETP5|nr:hypothetical protein PPL_09125 [Heterostelium album PN500]EFA78473.1 hypothetical protein PPL_09125 [Heterostelium album PN500]|eukprot:XP_020430597.1 hypothetical protein PPL_09125 [Heterostelium album PN500]
MHSIHHHHNQALQQLHGYLYKEGGIYKSWKKRWFCIEGDCLKYYVNESKTELKGSILISAILSVKPMPQKSLSSNNIATVSDQSLFSTLTDVNSSGGSSGSNSRSDRDHSRDGGKETVSGSLSKGANNPLSRSMSSTSNRPISMSGSIISFHNTGIGLNSSDSGNSEWIFSVGTQPRTYTLRAATEIEMYYWIQGLRGLQLESNLLASESKKNDRPLSKSGGIAGGNHKNNNEDIDYYRSEVQRLKYSINEMKQHIQQTKKDFQIAVTDHKSFISVIQEQFTLYKRQHEQPLRRQNSNINNNNNSNCNNNNNNNSNNNNCNKSLDTSNSNNQKNVPLQQYPPSKHPITDHIAPNGMALWQPDASTLNCFTCKINFTFFRRRHHCRNCGQLFCSKCSSHSAKAQGYHESVKVCIQCAQYIWTKHEQTQNVLSLSN